MALIDNTSGLEFVVVSIGKYAENVTLVDGINVFGGYDLDFDERDLSLWLRRSEG